MTLSQIVLMGAGLLSLICAMFYLVVKGLGKVTDIDEDEMTKFFDK
jgi:hypothetical protein